MEDCTIVMMSQNKLKQIASELWSIMQPINTASKKVPHNGTVKEGSQKFELVNEYRQKNFQYFLPFLAKIVEIHYSLNILYSTLFLKCSVTQNKSNARHQLKIIKIGL